jgi:hypothetical protein
MPVPVLSMSLLPVPSSKASATPIELTAHDYQAAQTAKRSEVSINTACWQVARKNMFIQRHLSRPGGSQQK